MNFQNRNRKIKIQLGYGSPPLMDQLLPPKTSKLKLKDYAQICYLQKTNNQISQLWHDEFLTQAEYIRSLKRVAKRIFILCNRLKTKELKPK